MSRVFVHLSLVYADDCCRRPADARRPHYTTTAPVKGEGGRPRRRCVGGAQGARDGFRPPPERQSGPAPERRRGRGWVRACAGTTEGACAGTTGRDAGGAVSDGFRTGLGRIWEVLGGFGTPGFVAGPGRFVRGGAAIFRKTVPFGSICSVFPVPGRYGLQPRRLRVWLSLYVRLFCLSRGAHGGAHGAGV